MDSEGTIEEIKDPWNQFGEETGPYDIIKDLEGNIWFTFYGGAFKYNPNTDHWSDYRSSLPTNTYCAALDGEGNVWFGTTSGVYKFNGISFSPPIQSGESGDRIDWVFDILPDASGTVWLGTYNGLSKINKSHDGWTSRIEINAIHSNYVEDIGFLSDGTARMLGQYRYIISYDGTFFREFFANDGCGFSWIKHMAVDKNNNTWFAFLGTDLKLKVIKLDPNNNATCYNLSGAVDIEWPDGYIRDVCFDNVDNIFWIATRDGLFLLNANNNFINNATTDNSNLPENDIQSVAVKGDRKVWYSTPSSGAGYLNYIDFSGEHFTTSNGLPSNTVTAMSFDNEGTLWMTADWKLIKYKDESFSSYFVPEYYTTVHADQRGNIWMGSSSGAAKFNAESFRTFTIEDGLIENNVSNISEDNEGNIWFSSGYYGVTKLKLITPNPDFETPITCLPEVTTLMNTSTETDTLSRYEWDIHNDGTIDYTTRDLEHQFEEKGKYEIRLRAYNNELYADVVKTITVLESPRVQITPEGANYICKGGFQTLSVELLNYNPLLDYNYTWNNGLKKKVIRTDTSGIFYAVVSNGECITVSDSSSVIISEPYPDAEICMVTVDSSVNKNMIIWERTREQGIASYNVYKLYGNKYVPIGNVPFNAKYSYYIDYQSSPDALAARYAITTIDTCGNESDFSAYHQTIHLGSSEGAEPGTKVLDWTPYLDESGIFEPEWYYIWAGEKPDEMEVVFTISGSFTEWNDTDPGNRNYYKIEARKPNACFVTMPDDKKAGSGPFVHSLSNLEDNTLKSGIEDERSGSLNIRPNPFRIETKIQWNASGSKSSKIYIYNLQGKIIKEEQIRNSHEFLLEREDLTSGVYFVKIISDKVYQGKLYVR
jgi:hypothetical protein